MGAQIKEDEMGRDLAQIKEDEMGRDLTRVEEKKNEYNIVVVKTEAMMGG